MSKRDQTDVKLILLYFTFYLGILLNLNVMAETQKVKVKPFLSGLFILSSGFGSGNKSSEELVK